MHALVDRGRLQRGETLLVVGAGGAAGYAAIQIGKWLGARVVASASTAAKRELARRGGADAVVDTRSERWREDVKAANGGKPIDVVFDPVGGSVTDPAFRSLGYDGRHLVIGFTGGITSLKTNLPLVKTASLIGVQLRVFSEHEPKKAAANMALVQQLAGQGVLKPTIGKTFRFEDFAAAMHTASGSELAGRVVIVTQQAAVAQHEKP
jgi:NADPH2:quinone reductase